MKSKLRHPIRAVREPFGTAGLIVACIALIAALGGTALAAKGALTGKQKKEVEKIAKKFAGKPGAQGPAGNPGAAGANGKDGTNGINGTNGADGVSTTTASFNGNAHGCPAGGVEVKSSSPAAFVCNGQNGQTGFTETLPSGKTETGVWGTPTLETTILMPASFSIPLAQPLTPAHVHLLPQGTEETEECPGTPSDPKAEPGEFCLYTSFAEQVIFLPAYLNIFPGLTGKDGVLVPTQVVEEGGLGFGSWAVTAP